MSIMDLNLRLLETVNQFAGKNHFLDKIVIDIVNGLPFLMCAVIAVIFVFGLVKKRPELRVGSFHIVVSLAINMILAHLLGQFFYETRPMYAHSNLNAPAHHVDDSSFPSDHATSTMTLAIGAFPISKILGWIFVGSSIVICLGKIYLAQHYPLDILLSYVFVILMRMIYVKILKKPVEKIYFLAESKIFGK